MNLALNCNLGVIPTVSRGKNDSLSFKGANGSGVKGLKIMADDVFESELAKIQQKQLELLCDFTKTPKREENQAVKLFLGLFSRIKNMSLAS